MPDGSVVAFVGRSAGGKTTAAASIALTAAIRNGTSVTAFDPTGAVTACFRQWMQQPRVGPESLRRIEAIRGAIICSSPETFFLALDRRMSASFSRGIPLGSVVLDESGVARLEQTDDLAYRRLVSLVRNASGIAYVTAHRFMGLGPEARTSLLRGIIAFGASDIELNGEPVGTRWSSENSDGQYTYRGWVMDGGRPAKVQFQLSDVPAELTDLAPHMGDGLPPFEGE